MSRSSLVSAALCLALASPAPSMGADLYHGGGWPALASDLKAEQVGDILTVVIYENSTASNSAQSSSKKDLALAGHITAGDSLDESADLALGGRSEGVGQAGRAGKIAAQISVTVDQVLPNGDLHVFGQQTLDIDGNRTRIRLKGRVRRADIASGNIVLSSRLADAEIYYGGRGFVTRGGAPGALIRIFNFLGLS